MTKQEAFFQYSLRIGDNSLILGQRLSEWCGHGPVLEEDIAMSNMSLDLIGQARGFLTYAGNIEGKGRTEDDLAFHRAEREFVNCNLVEQPNGDFAVTTMRSFLYSVYAWLLYRELSKSSDETLSGLAEKSVKEVAYHLRHTSQWVIRLGDGTDESHKRVQNALNDLYSYVPELFESDEVNAILIKEGIAPDMNKFRDEYNALAEEIISEATLTVPPSGYISSGGIKGLHSEHLGKLLAEMQWLPRSMPDAKW